MIRLITSHFATLDALELDAAAAGADRITAATPFAAMAMQGFANGFSIFRLSVDETGHCHRARWTRNRESGKPLDLAPRRPLAITISRFMSQM